MVVLVAFSPPLALPSGVCGTLDFYLSGPCSRGCRAAWADAPSRGVFGYFPFIYGLAAAGVAACGSGTCGPLLGAVWFPRVVASGRRRRRDAP